ncbi:hypothetical protein ACFX2C_012699 [Malus domestica]
MGPMTPIVFDMAQVFGLKPSGRCLDITHNWSFSSQLAAGSSEASQDIVSLEFPKGVALARILAEALVTNHSTFSYLYFFKICRTITDLEWDAFVLMR